MNSLILYDKNYTPSAEGVCQSYILKKDELDKKNKVTRYVTECGSRFFTHPSIGGKSLETECPMCGKKIAINPEPVNRLENC